MEQAHKTNIAQRAVAGSQSDRRRGRTHQHHCRQTNLLAPNATIEAARAEMQAEASRCRIRGQRLAEQTAKATGRDQSADRQHPDGDAAVGDGYLEVGAAHRRFRISSSIASAVEEQGVEVLSICCSRLLNSGNT